MKKTISILMMIAMVLFAAPSMAKAATLKTISTFSGADAASQTYVELLKTFEEQTGHKIEDHSSTSDEAWKAGVINDFAAGNEADVLFYFAKTADSVPILSKVVPISEINAAYPNLNLIESELVREADGLVYAVPVREWWEALFVNKDLFDQYGLDLPTDWDKLLKAISVFNANGIVPIAVSFSDIPHYIVEFAIGASGTPEEHAARPMRAAEIPASWKSGMALLHELYQLGAFAPDCTATTEQLASNLFLDKKAAMQLDGSWFANGIDIDSYDTTIVMPFPMRVRTASSTKGVIFKGVTSGFYLTRKAWNDPDTRDAAVALLAFLTNETNVHLLGNYAYSGALGDSIDDILKLDAYGPVIQDAMKPDIRSELWFSKIPGIVDGTIDPGRMWRAVIAADPFFNAK